MSVFSVPIFFIVFRETLEAAIIVSVLLGLVEQLVRDDDGTHLFVPIHPHAHLARSEKAREAGAVDGDEHDKGPAHTLPELRHSGSADSSSDDASDVSDEASRKRLVKRLRMQIFLGAGLGLLLALALGAAFIAVWFTQASDLWAKSEELWEAIFSLVASLIILVMGLTMLRMDRAKAAWRVKLQRAFAKRSAAQAASAAGRRAARDGRIGRLTLFLLPFITVLREGLEAVVFVGGVSLGEPAKAIPLAAIVGIICGVVIGVVVWAFASRAALSLFLVIITNLLLLLGAGLFSRSVWAFQMNAYVKLLGADVDDAGGDGPGSFDVRGSVWHLDCCNPENKVDGGGWGVFTALFGWTNSATIGSVLAYVFYWLAIIAALVFMKWKEGRVGLFGRVSAAGLRRKDRRAAAAAEADAARDEKRDSPRAGGVEELPR